MATTTNWSITYPTSANQITPLETHFANLAGSTDTALTNVRNQSGRYTGTNAQRLALTAATGRSEGTEFYATDTDKNWMYDGTQWLNADPGLYVITPAAAPSGFTVGADGSLTATNLASGYRSFDNIFSGRFRNYRIEVNVTKSNTSPSSAMQFRSGSTTLTSANYSSTAIYYVASGNSSGAPIGGVNTGLTSMPNIVDDAGTNNYSIVELANPFVSEQTILTSQTVVRGGMWGHTFHTGAYEATDSITGVSINFGQTVSSVRIRFYGYA